MKRYCGCISPTERRKRPREDEERNSAKNIAAYFQAAIFFSAVKCLWNGGKPKYLMEVINCLFTTKCSYENVRLTDWNSRTEQRERP